MDALSRVCDFLNLNFAFYAMNFFNVMWFSSGSPKYLIFYLVILAYNIYVVYVILRIKDRVTCALVMACAEQQPLSLEDRRALRKRLERSLQLGDLAEVAFGRFGRMVTESALVLCIISMVTSQMCTVRLVFIITARLANMSDILIENATQPHIQSAPDSMWEASFSAYAIFLPIFLIFSLLPSYRTLAPVSFVGIIAIAIASIHVISFLIDAGTFYVHQLSDITNLDAVYVFESSSPQIGLLILSLSNSASGNRKGFMFTMLAAAIVCFCGILFVGMGLLFHDYNHWHYPLLMKFYQTLPQNIVMLMGYVAFVFFLNLPLFELLERCASKITAVQPLDGLQPFTTDRSSVFAKLRRRDRGLDLLRPPRIYAEDVKRDVSVEISWWLKYFLRFFIVCTEWAFSILCWRQKDAIVFFIGIEMVSTIFMGYVLPIIQYLRLMWREVKMIIKLLSSVIVITTIAMTIYAYFLEVKLYINFNENIPF